jgi:putative intracellular protease/amidase
MHILMGAATHALHDIDASEFDAAFYPGGHGPLWDLTAQRLLAVGAPAPSIGR